MVSQWLVGPDDGIDFDVFKSDYLCLACHVHYKLVISRDDGTGRVAAVALLCSRFSNQHKRQKEPGRIATSPFCGDTSKTIYACY